MVCKRGIIYGYSHIFILFYIVVSTSLGEDIIDVNIGENKTLLFKVNFTNTVHVISVKKNDESIGSYDLSNGAFVNSKYQKRYDIEAEQEIGLWLQIKQIQAEDEGLFTVTITYEFIPEVKLQRFLKVKGLKQIELKTIASIVVSCSQEYNCLQLKDENGSVLYWENRNAFRCDGNYSLCLEKTEGHTTATQSITSNETEATSDNSVFNWYSKSSAYILSISPMVFIFLALIMLLLPETKVKWLHSNNRKVAISLILCWLCHTILLFVFTCTHNNKEWSYINISIMAAVEFVMSLQMVMNLYHKHAIQTAKVKMKKIFDLEKTDRHWQCSDQVYEIVWKKEYKNTHSTF